MAAYPRAVGPPFHWVWVYTAQGPPACAGGTRFTEYRPLRRRSAAAGYRWTPAARAGPARTEAGVWKTLWGSAGRALPRGGERCFPCERL